MANIFLRRAVDCSSITQRSTKCLFCSGMNEWWLVPQCKWNLATFCDFVWPRVILRFRLCLLFNVFAASCDFKISTGKFLKGGDSSLTLFIYLLFPSCTLFSLRSSFCNPYTYPVIENACQKGDFCSNGFLATWIFSECLLSITGLDYETATLEPKRIPYTMPHFSSAVIPWGLIPAQRTPQTVCPPPNSVNINIDLCNPFFSDSRFTPTSRLCTRLISSQLLEFPASCTKTRLVGVKKAFPIVSYIVWLYSIDQKFQNMRQALSICSGEGALGLRQPLISHYLRCRIFGPILGELFHNFVFP